MFQLHTLNSTERHGRIVMNAGQVRMWKLMVVAYCTSIRLQRQRKVVKVLKKGTGYLQNTNVDLYR